MKTHQTTKPNPWIAKDGTRRQLEQLVKTEEFVPRIEPKKPQRLLRGPHVHGGDLLELQPGEQAVALVSPSGEAVLLQNHGPVSIHVPDGWRLMVTSLPLKSKMAVKNVVNFDGQARQVESFSVVTRLDHIPEIYEELQDAKLI